MFTSNSKIGKKYILCDFNRSTVVGVKRAGLKIPDTAELLGYSSTTYSQKGAKNKLTSCEQMVCRLVLRLTETDRKSIITQIIMLVII